MADKGIQLLHEFKEYFENAIDVSARVWEGKCQKQSDVHSRGSEIISPQEPFSQQYNLKI